MVTIWQKLDILLRNFMNFLKCQCGLDIMVAVLINVLVIPISAHTDWDTIICQFTCWGADHTKHFWYHLLASPALIVWKVVGQHLFLNIIPSEFTAGTRWKFWCDWHMNPQYISQLWWTGMSKQAAWSAQNHGWFSSGLSFHDYLCWIPRFWSCPSSLQSWYIRWNCKFF